MPKPCSFGLCKNNSSDKAFRFFQFPRSDLDAKRRRLWAIRCGRKRQDGSTWEPNPNTPYVYVCSAHFISGKQTAATSLTKKPLQTCSDVLFNVPAMFCEIEVTTIERPTQMSFAEPKAASCALRVGRHLFVDNNSNITFLVLSGECNPRIDVCCCLRKL